MERFADIAEAMGENISGLSVRDAAEVAILSIQKLSEDVGIPSGLEGLGVKEADMEIMAKNAQKDACSFTNPRKASLQNVIEIYKNAM